VVREDRGLACSRDCGRGRCAQLHPALL
jgi:hypothetical protein